MQLVELERRGYESPFPPGVAGFDDAWWRSLDWAVRRPHVGYFQMICDKEEVARAVIIEDRLRSNYLDFDTTAPTVEVDKFEVRADRRGQGVGRRAVSLLRAQFPTQQFVAFSHQADAFWERVGFELKRRTDSGERHSPLYSIRALR